jgi:hypothetical protein
MTLRPPDVKPVRRPYRAGKVGGLCRGERLARPRPLSGT